MDLGDLFPAKSSASNVNSFSTETFGSINNRRNVDAFAVLRTTGNGAVAVRR